VIDPDRIREFAETHRKELAIAGLSVILGIAIVSLIRCGLGSAKGDAKKRPSSVQSSMALNPDELSYPREPLSIPGVQRSRDPKSAWTAEDAGKWYTPPDEQTLGTIRAAGRKRIDELLESVP